MGDSKLRQSAGVSAEVHNAGLKPRESPSKMGQHCHAQNLPVLNNWVPPCGVGKMAFLAAYPQSMSNIVVWSSGNITGLGTRLMRIRERDL